MRAKGINYDTGFFSVGTSTHEPFEPETVRREMRVDLDMASAGVVKVLDSRSGAAEPRGRRYAGMP